MTNMTARLRANGQFVITKTNGERARLHPNTDAWMHGRLTEIYIRKALRHGVAVTLAIDLRVRCEGLG